MRTPHRLRFPITVMVALALIVAQLAGIAHRVEHPRDLADHVHVTTALAEQGESSGDMHHDCAAYDAATLSSGPPLALNLSACALAASDRAHTAHRAWMGGPPLRAYASRAPPRS